MLSSCQLTLCLSCLLFDLAVVSAALGFAPVRKRAKPSPAANLAALAASSNALSTLPAGFVTVQQPTAAAASTTISAAPVIFAPPSLTIPEDEPTSKGSQKKFFKAPPLTLDQEDDDVNGFKQSAAGKKAAARKVCLTDSHRFYPHSVFIRQGKNKRRNQNRAPSPDPARDFSAEYDPAKPNDYARRLSLLPIAATCAQTVLVCPSLIG